ncbi:hypothetical protein [Spongiactinospora sp. TRM90649]|uniref:hypothetical protein n=1 Tax=Spongiactinospora sp. TRM90649 TaxID=3031114 RepID=UPI0023F7DBAC|nr:hypothetical protein [Spongiactinospora sp. TRM90649]MDF5758587.1 hypothetical protein [Spongiactinospora sp. TRM90649]
MTQTALWDVDRPTRAYARRWTARCDDCERRVWAEDSLRMCPDGRRRGEHCRRAWMRAHRRLHIPQHIPVRPPGDIPGQLDLTAADPPP